MTLLHLTLVALLSSFSNAIMLENDIFEPVPMHESKQLSIRLSFDETTDEEDMWNRDNVVVLSFNLTDKYSWALEVMNESLTFNYDQIRRRKPQEITIKGIILGFNHLEVYGHIVDVSKRPNFIEDDLKAIPIKMKPAEDEFASKEVEEDGENEDKEESHQVTLSPDERTLMRTIDLFVVVKSQFLPDLFTLVMTLMIIMNTVNMGGQLDLEIIKKVFRSPIGPAVGFVSQFLFMPLFSFGIGWLMSKDRLFRLGLFVLGCCPGGSASNFWCILLGGDINLSITMTFISTIAALGMMPMWIYLMGPLLADGSLVIPYDQLIITLILLIAPISLGMWIRYRWPKASVIMDKIIVPFTLLTVLFIFTVGVYINLFIFQLIDGLMVLAGFLVAGAGYFLGGLLAWAFKLSRPQIIAVAIETAFQNGGIAFIILKVSLPEPFGELATVAPVAQLVITGLPLWALLILWKVYTKCIRKKKAKVEKEPIVEPISPGFDSLKDFEALKSGEKKSLVDPLLLQSQSVVTTETDVY